jgi:predicted ATP-grasp superfamily ATP-dependent carboligase
VGALALLGAVLSAVGSAKAETATLGVRVDAVEKDGAELKGEIRQNYQAMREDVRAVNEKLDRLIERRTR